jgi:hypothetical protein
VAYRKCNYGGSALKTGKLIIIPERVDCIFERSAKVLGILNLLEGKGIFPDIISIFQVF